MVASGAGAIVSKVTTQRYPPVGSPDGVFKQVLYKAPNGFPVGIVWLAAFFFIAYIVLNHTRVGRYTFAIGSNAEATRLSGVNVDKWTIIVYTIVGFYAGMAGVMYAAAYTSIVPATGAGMEILGIAAVVIGGTSLAGGSGSLFGTIIGVYIMAVLKQGLMSMGLQGHYQTFFTGIVVILAVMLDNYRTKKASQVKKAAD
jgi:ribose transport system permease protein